MELDHPGSLSIPSLTKPSIPNPDLPARVGKPILGTASTLCSGTLSDHPVVKCQHY